MPYPAYNYLRFEKPVRSSCRMAATPYPAYNYLRFENSVPSSCRMAAMPYPAYNSSPYPVL